MPDTIDDLVRLRADHDGDKPMVIDPDSRITYAELDATTRDLAAAFIAAGVGKGTRVGLIMPNCVQWVQIAVALTRIGAVLVPLSTLLQPPELVAQLRVASVQFLVSGARSSAATAISTTCEPLRIGASLRCGEVWTADRLPPALGRTDRRRRQPKPSRPATLWRSCSRREAAARPRASIHSHGNALGAVRSGLAARCIDRRHPAVPADAVLLGRRIRQRRAVGTAGRRHAGHRTDPPAGDHAAAAGERACHAVSRLARPGRSAGTPNRCRRSRPVGTAPGQPGGAAARRAAGRARSAGDSCSG